MRLCLGFLALVATAATALGDVAAERSAVTVERWSACGRRLGLPRGRKVRRVVSHSIGGTAPVFHEIRFEGGGFAVTDASDPDGGIIAFSDHGEVVEREDNPLWAILCKHMMLRSVSEGARKLAQASQNQVSDLRVAPLLKSKWDQSTAGGGKCYNYYTPNGSVCGCVATAMAQLMRYHEWPQKPLKIETNVCYFNETPTNLTMKGGPYDWQGMPYVPGTGTTESNREAIGRLTYDCGVTVRMHYTKSSSGAWGGAEHLPLKSVFGYASAQAIDVYADESQGETLDEGTIRDAVLSNLDAKCPVLLGVVATSSDTGHCIVADGYGYADDICYVHLNMGWSGSNDAWYALPEVNAGWYKFNIVDSATYNVFPAARGVVVSGHVTVDGTNGVGVAITFKDRLGRTAASVQSDTNGVYAAVVSESTSYRVIATCGRVALTNGVVTGFCNSISTMDWETGEGKSARPVSCGNVWGNDFDLILPAVVKRDLYVSAADGDDATGTGTETAPFATIAAALATIGEDEETTVWVSPGVYTGTVEAVIGLVSVRSLEGPENTVIDAQEQGPCYYAVDCSDAVLSGFTLQNGRYLFGGGVCCGIASNCIIRNCSAYCSRYASDSGIGGGACGAVLYDTYMFGNSADAYGGGASGCDLLRCTVYGNVAGKAGAGIDYQSACLDCIVWGNTRASGDIDNWEAYSVRTWSGTTVYVPAMDGCCTAPEITVGEGNLFADPRLVEPNAGDFRLWDISPCLGAGMTGGNVGAYQGAGEPTVLPVLPSQASGAAVLEAVAALPYADPGVADYIGSDAARYESFRAWTATFPAGAKAIVLGKNAYLSFALRDLVAAPYLLLDNGKAHFEFMSLAPVAGGWNASVRLKDGDVPVPLQAAKAAFADKVRLGTSPDALSPATADDILSAASGEDGSVVLTIRPPSSAAGFFRIRVD